MSLRRGENEEEKDASESASETKEGEEIGTRDSRIVIEVVLRLVLLRLLGRSSLLSRSSGFGGGSSLGEDGCERFRAGGSLGGGRGGFGLGFGWS